MAIKYKGIYFFLFWVLSESPSLRSYGRLYITLSRTCRIWESVIKEDTHLPRIKSSAHSSALTSSIPLQLIYTVTSCNYMGVRITDFHTKSLRRILRILWPSKIANEDLLRQWNQESIATILIRRRWQWIGHVIRRYQTSITKTAFHWTPEGKWKCERPKNAWRRTVEEELKSLNHSWGTIEKMANDRQKWKTFVGGLHANCIPDSK